MKLELKVHTGATLEFEMDAELEVLEELHMCMFTACSRTCAANDCLYIPTTKRWIYVFAFRLSNHRRARPLTLTMKVDQQDLMCRYCKVCLQMARRHTLGKSHSSRNGFAS